MKLTTAFTKFAIIKEKHYPSTGHNEHCHTSNKQCFRNTTINPHVLRRSVI